MSLPRVLVFDLDGCTWWPEMCKLTFIIVITAHVTKQNTVFLLNEPAGSSFFGGFKIWVILE